MLNIQIEKTFSYHWLRGLVGAIALLIAIVAAYASRQGLESISASYHSAAQDLFVGSLFVVAAFLGAYKGSPNSEKGIFVQYVSAKMAAISVLLVAVFPADGYSCKTSNPDCVPWYVFDLSGSLGTTSGSIHSFAAVIFFLMLFVLMTGFALRAWRKKGGACRAIVYAICCIVMVVSVAFVTIEWDPEQRNYGGVFWAELVALAAFGFGWVYSGIYEWLQDSRWPFSCPLWLTNLQKSR